MSHTQNTKPQIYKYHEAWAKENGYRSKDQAASLKPEELNAANSDRFVKGASSKPQARRFKRQA